MHRTCVLATDAPHARPRNKAALTVGPRCFAHSAPPHRHSSTAVKQTECQGPDDGRAQADACPVDPVVSTEWPWRASSLPPRLRPHDSSQRLAQPTRSATCAYASHAAARAMRAKPPGASPVRRAATIPTCVIGRGIGGHPVLPSVLCALLPPTPGTMPWPRPGRHGGRGRPPAQVARRSTGSLVHADTRPADPATSANQAWAPRPQRHVHSPPRYSAAHE